MSVIFEAATRRWHELRTEYEIFREHAYAAAEAATNGIMLNARGRSRHLSLIHI